MEIREFRADEWRLYRTVRLRALAGAPDAFGTTLSEAEARSDADWRGFVASSASSTERALFGAFDQDEPCGTAFVAADADGGGDVHLAQMWVDAGLRGRGTARDLLAAAEAWARERQATRLVLTATEGNDAAIGLYERAGFATTGATEPLRAGSAVLTREMAKELT